MSRYSYLQRFLKIGFASAICGGVGALGVSLARYRARGDAESSYATYALKAARWLPVTWHPARHLLLDVATQCAHDEANANLLLCELPQSAVFANDASGVVEWLRAVANGSAVSARVRALVARGGAWRDELLRRLTADSDDRTVLCALVALANAGGDLSDARARLQEDAALLARLADAAHPQLQEQLSRVAPLLAVDALLASSEPIVQRNVTAALAASSLDRLWTDKYADGLYLLHQDSDAAYDIVLIHGVTGDAYGTWVQEEHDDVVWPRDWLPHDLGRIRVLSVGFELFLSRWWGNALPLKERARSISGLLRLAGVGKRPVIFVTHSFGGLLAKEIVVSGQVANVAGVVFYSTPHRGADLVWLMDAMPTLTRGTTAAQELLPDSHQLSKLQTAFLQRRVPTLSIGEAVTCGYPTRYNCVQVVSDASARLCDACPFVKLDHDHRRICKPATTSDPRYTAVVDFIHKVIAGTAPRN